MFSIGIPAFKSKFLSSCISSILNQSYENFELIIIDDCSNDPIKEIIEEFDDYRINYFRNQKNIGAINVVDNWNECLKRSKNEYFILMGDDDEMRLDYLEEFVKLISKYPNLDVYHCRSNIINENSDPIGVTPINPDFEDIYDYILSCIEGHRQQFISDFVYRTAELKAVGGFHKFPLGWISDYVSAFIACGDKGIAHTNNCVFNYRANQYSITSTSNIELKWSANIEYQKWLEFYLKSIPENKVNSIKYKKLKNSVDKFDKMTKIYLIRQLIGSQNVIKGLVKCWTKRDLYNISLKDIFGALLSATLNKLIDNII